MVYEETLDLTHHVQGGKPKPRMAEEVWPLLKTSRSSSELSTTQGGLSLIFATLCLIDLFGVFPIMALPGSIIRCGWLGIPLAVGVFSLQIYTAILLGRCWIMAEMLDPSIVQKSRYPYAALAEEVLGSRARSIVTVFLDLAVFGGGIPNLLIAAQNLQLFGIKMSCFAFNMPFCIWLVFLGIVLSPLMWLGSPKDMKWLAVTSVGTVLSVATLTWSSMLLDESITETVVIPPPTWEALALTYGILAFQFDIHPNILTIQVDMEDKSKMGKAVILSFFVTGCLSIVTTFIALLQYGELARPNLLQGLPGSQLLYFNVLLVTLQICLSMVVGGSALFQDVENTLGVPREFNWKRCVIRTLILMTAVFLAETVPRFDLVMGLIGGALTGPLMFFFPPLFYIKLNNKLKEREQQLGLAQTTTANNTSNGIYPGLPGMNLHNPRNRYRRLSDVSIDDQICGISWEIIFAYGVIVLGVLATITSTYFGLEESIRFSKFIPSCLQNSSAASDLALFLDVDPDGNAYPDL